jgi:NAD(P)H dehydrogenase (quinone)
MMLPLLHHGCLIVGLPFTEARLSNTRTGGSPYGASHVSGADGKMPLSDDESFLAKALGIRVAQTSQKLGL